MRRKCQSLDDCSPTKVTIVRFSLLLLRYIQYAKDAIGINWFERLRWCQNSHKRFNLHTKKIKVRFFFLLMRLPVRELNVRLEPWPLFLAHKRVDYREIWQTILDMQSNGITLLKNPWVRSFWCKDSQNVEKGKRDWGMFFRKRKGKKPVFFLRLLCCLLIIHLELWQTFPFVRKRVGLTLIAWRSEIFLFSIFLFIFFSNKRNRYARKLVSGHTTDRTNQPLMTCVLSILSKMIQSFYCALYGVEAMTLQLLEYFISISFTNEV